MVWSVEIGTREAPGTRKMVGRVHGDVRRIGAREALLSWANDENLSDGLRFRLSTSRMAVADVDDLVIVARPGVRDYETALAVERMAGRAS